MTVAAALPLRPRRRLLPGFGLTLGFTLFWLSLIVLVPLSTILVQTLGMSPGDFLYAAFNERVLRAYRLSFGAALAAAGINAVAGLLVAWVLVRYHFPFKRLVSAMVDLPFALPTAVAGIALTALYADSGWIGGLLAPFGIRIAYTPAGVVIALIFIGLPFVVRSVEPVLEDLGRDVEEAAAALGATRWQTFRRVILPAVGPALLTGFALAFARGLGEYGSVIFIAGNMPFHSEIAPLMIITELEQYDYPAATAIATVMLVASFLMLLAINLIQIVVRRRTAAA
ncbi:MAG: sulfate ABC transporter permease subunit CysT [Sphingomonas fennica]